MATVAGNQKINKRAVFQNADIFPLFDPSDQFTVDFFACHIFAVQDPGSGVGAFFGVGKAVSLFVESNAQIDQIFNDFL
ncbi:hypothetical protein SDC9_87787 [bioreactor metagenome]|uniref:Uncharacterized protein n=1 Tax=bioreactor metagenome TaxID=1076179 RepID=A0A644ZK86_9ZZZZ